MEAVSVVVGLAILEYFVFGMLVARARGAAGIEAPATTGDPNFERHFRVQQNTLEQLAIFLPSIWLFATYISANAAAGLGLVFIVGRILYLRGYVADPAKRGTGFAIGTLAQMILLLGGIGGAVAAWL
jgi:uncharacterized MAPEG superfamily protein